MNRLHLYFLSLALFFLGLAIFLYKWLFLGFPLAPHSNSNVWNLEIRVSFDANEKAVRASVFIPKSTSRISLLDESFISQGFVLTSSIEEGNRVAEWYSRKAAGHQSLYYHAVVRVAKPNGTIISTKTPELIEPGFEGAALVAAQNIIAQARTEATSTSLDSFVGALIKNINQTGSDDNRLVLLGPNPGELQRLDLLVRLLALLDIPARAVHGISLGSSGSNVPLEHWLEVHDEKSWLSFDPVSGRMGLEKEMLPWWRGNYPLGQLSGAHNLSTRIALSVHEEEAIRGLIESTRQEQPFWVRFSLFSLPLETQAVFRIMLLVPLGALLVVILRNIVGLETFGTFMPVLVALAFRDMAIYKGVFFFSLVVSLGLVMRFYLEGLKLLLVPRLGAILTLVVLLLAGLSILCSKYGFDAGPSMALFPMVIMTMTIERMSIVWDESGPFQAIRQGVGSLFAAVLAALIMGIAWVEHLFFVFPELLLIILALNILLGRYTGYRLLELWRFKAFSAQ